MEKPKAAMTPKGTEQYHGHRNGRDPGSPGSSAVNRYMTQNTEDGPDQRSAPPPRWEIFTEGRGVVG